MKYKFSNTVNSGKDAKLALLSNRNKCFKFKKCFSEKMQNNEIYNEVVKEIISDGLKGVNGSIINYGQTGSGKTFTMLGHYSKDSTLKSSFVNDQYKDLDSLSAQ